MTRITLELPSEIAPQEARLLLAAKLYEMGRVSAGQSAAIAGCSNRVFLELLGTLGIPVFDYPAEDLADEVAR